MPSQPHTRITNGLLLLFPPSFRAEFGDEMLDVLGQALSQDAKRGSLAHWRTYLGELGDLAREGLFQRWTEVGRRSTEAQSFGNTWKDALTLKERSLAMAAFVVPIVALLANSLSDSTVTLAAPLIVVFLCAMFFTGLLRGFPRWSLPYLGLVLSAISFLYLFNGVSDLTAPYALQSLGFDAADVSQRLLLEVCWSGLMWLGLFVLVILALASLSLWRRFRQLAWRLQWDWTQVSFIIYGGLALALVLMFQNYSYEEPYAVASLLCLAGGAWLYLRSPHGLQRILVLVAGATMAMCVIAVGKWLILPLQDWNIWARGVSMESERWLEAERTLIGLASLLVILLAPGLLRLLLPRRQSAPT